MTDIISPPASQRAVYVDYAFTYGESYAVEYLYPEYTSQHRLNSHAKGITLSMADGHAEYWKWRGRETVDPKLYLPLADNRPVTEDGLLDLQRLQRAIWGRLGYAIEEKP